MEAAPCTRKRMCVVKESLSRAMRKQGSGAARASCATPAPPPPCVSDAGVATDDCLDVQAEALGLAVLSKARGHYSTKRVPH